MNFGQGGRAPKQPYVPKTQIFLKIIEVEEGSKKCNTYNSTRLISFAEKRKYPEYKNALLAQFSRTS